MITIWQRLLLVLAIHQCFGRVVAHTQFNETHVISANEVLNTDAALSMESFHNFPELGDNRLEHQLLAATVASETDSEEGRRRRHRRKKMKNKHKMIIFPVIGGLLIAKALLIPLFLKGVAILSKSSFILSSLSFVFSLLLGIRWLTAPTEKAASESTRIEVLHVPGHKGSSWIDRDMEDNKYIPLPYESYYSPTDKSIGHLHHQTAPFLK